LRADHNVELEFVPFELHPEIPPQGWKSEENPYGYTTHVEEYIERLAKQAGLPLNVPDFIPNTRLALEATKYAKEKGDPASVIRRVFEAYFAEGRDIGDPEVVADVFSEVGYDREEVLAVINQRRYAHQLDHDIEDALAMGIEMTPAAQICNRLLTGAKPYQIFEEAVSECVRHET